MVHLVLSIKFGGPPVKKEKITVIVNVLIKHEKNIKYDLSHLLYRHNKIQLIYIAKGVPY